MRSIFFLCISVIANIALAQPNPCNRNIPASNFPGDTTIVLQSGTTLTFNRCEYFDIRNCIEIKELQTANDLSSVGINMTTDNGVPLMTGGMLSISFKDCTIKKLEVPVYVCIKIKYQDCSKPNNKLPNFYFGGKDNWLLATDKDYDIRTKNGEKFMCFKTFVGGSFNCDKTIPIRKKVKFKAPRNYRIDSIKLGMDCPLFFYAKKNNRLKRKIKVPLITGNPNQIQVQVQMINKTNADTITVVTKTLNKYKNTRRKLYELNNANNFLYKILHVFYIKTKSAYLFKKYKVDLQKAI